MNQKFIWIFLNTIIQAIVVMHLATNSIAAISLDWEIGNRFRVFDFLASDDPKRSKEYFEIYAPSQDETLEAWLERRSNDTKKDRGRGVSPFEPDKPGPWIETPRDGSPPHYEKALVQLPAYVHLTVTLIVTPGDGKLPLGICQVFLGTTLYKTFLGEGACNDSIQLERVPPIKGTLSVELSNIVLAKEPFDPKLKVILGMGDSYGAGEGSPDQPTLWKSGQEGVWINTSSYERPKTKRKEIQSWVGKPAHWNSTRCNRSFFAAQSMVALKMAKADRQNIISFVHLSCAGAEIIDGLLASQRLPLGRPNGHPCDDIAKAKQSSRAVNERCDVAQPQLAAAVDLLCQIDTSRFIVDPSHIDAIRSRLHGILSKNEQISWVTNDRRYGLHWCPVDKRIAPSYVLLQVGGNDVGFSGIIAWALVSSKGHSDNFIRRVLIGNRIAHQARSDKGVVCPSARALGCAPGLMPALDQIKDLPLRYDALSLALDLLLGVPRDRIVLPGYPNPLRDKDGELCRNPQFSNEANQWTAAKIAIPQWLDPVNWQFNITANGTDGEADYIEHDVVEQLNKAIHDATIATIQKDQDTNQPKGWRFVDVFDVMGGDGWCTFRKGGWKGLLPAPKELPQWNAYVNHIRKIRTTNDSALSQWPDENREDWISGTFHPNAWGYAAIAKRMLEAIR